MDNRRMRSTDRDLLVMQSVLGRLRNPKLDQAAIDKKVAAATPHLTDRFVQAKFGTNVVTVPRIQKERKLKKMYNLTVVFALRDIPVKHHGEKIKVNARSEFRLENMPGSGADGHLCLRDAKEHFRLWIGNNLREPGSKVRVSFLKETQLEIAASKVKMDIVPPALRLEALDIFRKWIGNNLRDGASAIRARFFEAVEHIEVALNALCPSCKKRQPLPLFYQNNKSYTVCAECREATSADQSAASEENQEDLDELDDE